MIGIITSVMIIFPVLGYVFILWESIQKNKNKATFQ